MLCMVKSAQFYGLTCLVFRHCASSFSLMDIRNWEIVCEGEGKRKGGGGGVCRSKNFTVVCRDPFYTINRRLSRWKQSRDKLRYYSIRCTADQMGLKTIDYSDRVVYLGCDGRFGHPCLSSDYDCKDE